MSWLTVPVVLVDACVPGVRCWVHFVARSLRVNGRRAGSFGCASSLVEASCPDTVKLQPCRTGCRKGCSRGVFGCSRGLLGCSRTRIGRNVRAGKVAAKPDDGPSCVSSCRHVEAATLMRTLTQRLMPGGNLMMPATLLVDPGLGTLMPAPKWLMPDFGEAGRSSVAEPSCGGDFSGAVEVLANVAAGCCTVIVGESMPDTMKRQRCRNGCCKGCCRQEIWLLPGTFWLLPARNGLLPAREWLMRLRNWLPPSPRKGCSRYGRPGSVRATSRAGRPRQATVRHRGAAVPTALGRLTRGLGGRSREGCRVAFAKGTVTRRVWRRASGFP